MHPPTATPRDRRRPAAARGVVVVGPPVRAGLEHAGQTRRVAARIPATSLAPHPLGGSASGTGRPGPEGPPHDRQGQQRTQARPSSHDGDMGDSLPSRVRRIQARPAPPGRGPARGTRVPLRCRPERSPGSTRAENAVPERGADRSADSRACAEGSGPRPRIDRTGRRGQPSMASAAFRPSPPRAPPRRSTQARRAPAATGGRASRKAELGACIAVRSPPTTAVSQPFGHRRHRAPPAARPPPSSAAGSSLPKRRSRRDRAARSATGPASAAASAAGTARVGANAAASRPTAATPIAQCSTACSGVHGTSASCNARDSGPRHRAGIRRRDRVPRSRTRSAAAARLPARTRRARPDDGETSTAPHRRPSRHLRPSGGRAGRHGHEPLCDARTTPAPTARRPSTSRSTRRARRAGVGPRTTASMHDAMRGLAVREPAVGHEHQVSRRASAGRRWHGRPHRAVVTGVAPATCQRLTLRTSTTRRSGRIRSAARELTTEAAPMPSAFAGRASSRTRCGCEASSRSPRS